jgi:16S rRNA (guanine527-N7)-methyltransferase
MAPSLCGKNVSRETLERLTHYHDLLLKWTKTINLISKSSMSEVWDRHIWDSAQIVDLVSNQESWLDIGSGAGFPGLVVSILAREDLPHRHVSLVESDQRKAAFLRTVIRQLDLRASVFVERIEVLNPANANVLSARALGDLDQLLGYAERHLAPYGTALFMKGVNWQKEVDIARNSWSFQLEAHKSKTSPEAAILEIKEIERV